MLVKTVIMIQTMIYDIESNDGQVNLIDDDENDDD